MVEVGTIESNREIEPYRQCPICWGRCGGYGVAYSTQGLSRYYRCCKSRNNEYPPCGHTWKVVLNNISLDVIRVEHKTIDIVTRNK